MVAHFTMRTYGVNQALLKAFGYIERVVKSDLKKKTVFTLYVRNAK